MDSQRKMRDYYEVLGIETTAEPKDIKMAYIKLAREWHPDKNIGNEAEAETKFKEISQAYETLSDPQERAWYDNHKEQILRGGDGTSGENESCFSGFGDHEGGFFKVYGSLFKDLNDEDVEAAEKNKYSLPPFGTSTCEWADVKAFYASWAEFTSRQSFSWADKYKTSDGPNRQIRRLIEKENKKERDKMRRGFNDLIRHLVKHVKGLDPRVKAHLAVEAAQLEERQKRAEIEKQEKAERARILKEERARQLQEEEEMERNREKMSGEEEEEEEEDEEEEEFYCAACHRKFRTQNQWNNHASSKKHKQQVELTKNQVSFDPETEKELQRQENERNGISESIPSDQDISTDEGDNNDNDNGDEDNISDEQQSSNGSNDDSTEDEETPLQRLKKMSFSPAPGSDSEDDSISEEAQIRALTPKQKKLKKKKGPQKPKFARLSLSSEDEEEPVAVETLAPEPESAIEDEEEEQGKSQGGKKKRRRAGKAKGAGTPTPNPSTPTKGSVDQKGGEENRCGKCGSNFKTRNLLFNHIKKTGHAIAK